MVKNPSATAGDPGQILCGKIPHAMEQLSQCVTTTESTATTAEGNMPTAHTPQGQPRQQEVCAPQGNYPPLTTTRESLDAAMKTQHSHK